MRDLLRCKSDQNPENNKTLNPKPLNPNNNEMSLFPQIKLNALEPTWRVRETLLVTLAPSRTVQSKYPMIDLFSKST